MAAGVDGRQQVVLLHYIEPRHCAQCGPDGDDVNGHQIHPGSPLGDRLHKQSCAQAQHAQHRQGRRAIQLRELVQQRFRHRFKHILQRADPCENHGHIQNNGE